MRALAGSLLALSLIVAAKSSIYSKEYHYHACSVLDIGQTSDDIVALPKIHLNDKDFKIGQTDNCALHKKTLIGSKVVVCALGGTAYVPPRLKSERKDPIEPLFVRCQSWLGISRRCPNGVDIFVYQYCGTLKEPTTTPRPDIYESMFQQILRNRNVYIFS